MQKVGFTAGKFAFFFAVGTGLGVAGSQIIIHGIDFLLGKKPSEENKEK